MATTIKNVGEDGKLQGTYVAPKLGRTLVEEYAESWLKTKRTHRRVAQRTTTRPTCASTSCRR